MFLKKRFLFVLFLLIVAHLIFSNDGKTQKTSAYVKSSNRRTAIRCLQISKDFLNKSEWTNAYLQAELGCKYDESVSDLWYVAAESKYRSGAVAADVLPLVKNAIQKDNWVDSFQNNARLLYSRLLCDTTEYYKAIEQLDFAPALGSAEAEYIRTLCLYRMGTEENLQKAREKVYEALKLFPDDNRFPLAFFTYELKEDFSFDDSVLELADSLVQLFTSPYEIPAELAIYAAAFAKGDLQIRMLKAFDAAGLRHPLYACLALKTKVISEQDAYKYFCSFAENEMNLKELVRFVSLLSDDSVLDAMKAFLNAYDGTMVHDLSGDGCVDFVVEYSRGRPLNIAYDINQDGKNEWTAACDFGVPFKISLNQKEISLCYGKYPFVSSVLDKDIGYSFPPDELEWTPMSLYAEEKLLQLLDGFQFFVPMPKTDFEAFLDPENLFNVATTIVAPTTERSDGRISATVLDGQFKKIEYFSGEDIYARLYFDAGVPSVRHIDMDGDGRFETTEEYVFVEETSGFEQDVYEKLFAGFPFKDGVRLKSIVLDENHDNKVDYMVVYSPEGEKESTWFDSDGKWTGKHRMNQNSVNAEAYFVLPVTGDVVTVYMEKGIPVRVVVEDRNSNFVNDLAVLPVEGVYWLGEAGSKEMSKKLICDLDEKEIQGLCVVSSYDDEETTSRFSAIRINGFYFGVVFDE